jgi:hypothetical protein
MDRQTQVRATRIERASNPSGASPGGRPTERDAGVSCERMSLDQGSAPHSDPALATLGRRRFLRWTAAAVVGVAAAWQGVRIVGGSVPDVSGLRALDARRYATLHALIRTLFPEGPLVRDPQAFATRRARVGDARLEELPPYVARDLGAGLLYLEAGPVLLEGRLTTFCQLDDATRAAHFARHWEDTDDALRRGAGVGLRRMISVWAYDTPEIWPAMHYPGPVLAPMPVE